MGVSGNLVCNDDKKRKSLINDLSRSINYDKKTEKANNEKDNQKIEGKIREILKCSICYSKAKKPKMCKYCNKIYCEVCINTWLETYLFCQMCKK